MGNQEPATLCSITHQTHMEDIQGSRGSWYGFMTTNAMTFGPDLLMSAKLSASLVLAKIAKPCHPWAQEPAPLCSITLQTHMEDIQGSGGSWYGFMTTNAMTFGPDLLMSAKLSSSAISLLAKIAKACHRASQHHSAASLFRPIWRIFKGLEAADMVSWPQMAWLFGPDLLMSVNFLASCHFKTS
jgi:hypothetical protein